MAVTELNQSFTIDCGLLKAVTFWNGLCILGLWVAYRTLQAVYNVSPLHPLYHFPGPRLAAMSFAYEAWFDFFPHTGRYSFEIKKMHEKYGPIIRINPDELHTNDYDMVDQIYAGGGHVLDKQQHYLNTVAGPLTQSSFGARDHETHRIRRSAVNRFFSRGQIMKLEPEVHQLAQRRCDKMLRWRQAPIGVNEAYNCFTADTISQYAFGQPLGFLEQNGWRPNFKAAFHAFLNTSYLFRFIPIVRNLVHLTPYLAKYMEGDMKLLVDEMTVKLPGHVERAMRDRENSRIFAELLDSKELPDSEKTVYRLAGEGFSLMSAGTETTAHHDEDIFPDSYTYNPERWIDPISGQKNHALEKYLMSFSKGSRQCLGMKWVIKGNHDEFFFKTR
ncbi:cytochrome P450 [Apiospora saccharicola]|uniref:Cytochrome P450 n=1 Tax=Apiospora saccharicola TaxID=335842 RepID=A0ABR1VMY1_9PEZI